MPRDQIQIRIGQRFKRRLDRAIENTDLSRNQWIENAIEEIINTSKPTRLGLTASELLHDKQVVLIRLDPDLLEELDEKCARLEYSRTMLILDALITKLANHHKARRKNG